jgi:hypothetical protein
LKHAEKKLITVNVVYGWVIYFTLMMEAISSSETQFLQELHGITSQKTTFFNVTAIKTSNLTWYYPAKLCTGDVMCLL